MRSLKFIAVCLFVCTGCLEPYSPKVDPVALNALVVDGYVDASGDGIVKLSRALPLYSVANPPIETGALVSIRSSTGEIFSLFETSPGNYTAENLPVLKQSSYTLHILAADGRRYESDAVKIPSTPPVDNMFTTVAATGEDLEIRVDSRDDNPESTGFYAWECIETYEYRAQLFSRYKRVNGVPVLREPGEFVDTCWREAPIPMSLATTRRLSENVISGHKVTTINKFSPKISRRYSILVRQRAISEEEYNYRIQLEKTGEEQGSIFAQIPGAVVSNVHSTEDPQEVVLGYFRGQEYKERRFFIGLGNIPDELRVATQLELCDLESTCPVNAPVMGPNTCIDIALLSESKIVISSFLFRNNTVYTFSESECGDCRVAGGKTSPPPYWF